MKQLGLNIASDLLIAPVSLRPSAHPQFLSSIRWGQDMCRDPLARDARMLDPRALLLLPGTYYVVEVFTAALLLKAAINFASIRRSFRCLLLTTVNDAYLQCD